MDDVREDEDAIAEDQPLTRRQDSRQEARSVPSGGVSAPAGRHASKSAVSLLQWPFAPYEHRCLARGKIPIAVYENEYSSIIAYTLASDDYNDFLVHPRTGNAAVPDVVVDDSDTAALPSSTLHFTHQFSDKTTKFYCQVFFASQFKALREKYLTDNAEEDFLRSLSRSAKWEASGGKSGSDFRKTVDDRFILKQMSRAEAHSFVEFAPHYLQYLTKAADFGCPTFLAKILGVYRIGFKNAATGRAMKQDVLVMENLFYDQKVTQIFDLKGSMRNRYVEATDGNNVLLDENFLDWLSETPLYMRQHTKVIFDQAIRNDASFLARNQVMDYSLLLGINSVRNELVVGIIDYIRTFTWDKRIEMYVKSSGILGGYGNLPTVVSPKLYKTRFVEAMDKYFLLVPDPWTRLSTIAIRHKIGDHRDCNCSEAYRQQQQEKQPQEATQS